MLTSSDIINGKGPKCDHLQHSYCPPDADSWISAGACFYGVDVLDGLLFGGHGPEYAPAKALLDRHFSEFEDRRRARAEAIVRFSPDAVLLFNPACILDPILDEIANLPALKSCPILSYVSDDWLIAWERSNPLIFLWRFLDSARGQPQLLSLSRLKLLESCLLWEKQGVFRFLSEPRMHHRFFTSRSLQMRYEREKPDAALGSVLPWGLPQLKDYRALPEERLRKEEPLTLVVTGQIEPHKGIYDLLQALLLTKRPNKLVLFGDTQTQHANFCRKFVEHSDLSGRVEFAGRLPPDKVWITAVEKAEVYLLPSRFIPGVFQEPFSIALLQAMASKFPVIASDGGGSPEAIASGENGLLHVANSPASIASAIDAVELNRTATAKLAKAALDRAHTYYSIETMTSKIEEYAQKLVASRRAACGSVGIPTLRRGNIFYLVHNANRDPANSGCVRVARRLGNVLQKEVRPWFVRWKPELAAVTFLDPVGAEYLSRFNGPSKCDVEEPHLRENGEVPIHLSRQCAAEIKNAWLILPELLDSQLLLDILAYARRQRMKCAAIFYDAIPLLRPELCSDEIRANHAAYMDALARCDLVIPISEFSSRCLLDHWTNRNIQPCKVVPILLAGEFNHHPLPKLTDARLDVEMLCVSTIEPRKNHKSLLAALDVLDRKAPELKWRMHFVGNSYAGALELSQQLESRCQRDSRIVWHRIVDDQRLGELYQRSDFTIYPSLIEGYGLPIVESVWHGKPCVCSKDGVMAELAADGGCVPVDVESPEAIADAIKCLMEDVAFREKLSKEASARVLKTWHRYGCEVLSALDLLPSPSASFTGQLRNLDDTLYPNCLHAGGGWQMSPAERAALTTLLYRVQPRVAIEVGTYKGGSLSLIRQFAHTVFSLDIDSTIPTRFRYMSNVSFLTAPSSESLPILFQELTAANLPVHFVLIDGDHSRTGVAVDVRSVIAQRPLETTYLLMHDSFNPDCRAGILDVDWASCPYVHSVEIDHVQGTVVDQPGGPFDGQMWGGFALAVLHASKRTGALHITQSARRSFERCRQSTL
ncbi:MAG: glycosyltransferase [Opitutaceae bacterium]|nr:glycosyltransferase [Opitutaceae bacterium]